MTKLTALIAGLAVAMAAPVLAQTAAPAPSAAPAPGKTYSTSTTDLATLAANPATKAVVDKYFPGLTVDDTVAMAGTMTLRSMQQYKPAFFPDAKLAAADAELAKVPVK